MANLNPLELQRLKSLLSGKTLTMDEKISALDTLRSKFSNFFSNLDPNLTEENLKDNNFLIKYLTNPYNRNKIRNALRKELSLSSTQQIELEASLEQPIATEVVSGQPGGQVAPAEQALPVNQPMSAPVGGMPGIPSAPAIPSMPRRVFVQQTAQPGGMEGGSGQGIAATNKATQIAERQEIEKPKVNRLNAQPEVSRSSASTPAPAPQGFNPRGFKMPEAVKTFRSNAQIFAKRNLGKVWDGLKGIGGGLGRGLAGGIGGGLEAAAPSLGRAFRGGLNGIERMSRLGGLGGGGGIPSITKVGKGRGKWVFISILLGMMFLTTLLGALPGSAPPGQAGPLPPPGGGGGDISNCKFTRAGQNFKLQSSKLASWISQAAAQVNIPAVITAGVAIIESPGFTPVADDNHDAIKNNYYYVVGPGSGTRAIGLMQVSTGRTSTDKGTVDHCTSLFDGGVIAQAAKNTGKQLKGGKDYYCVDDVDERVRRFCQFTGQVYHSGDTIPPDFQYFPQTGNDDQYFNLCRITDNLAAGVLILRSKIGNGDWNNETDVKNAVHGYYGQCEYTQNGNTYNYCNEVWNEYQNCKVQTPSPGGDFASQLVAKIKNSQACGGFVNRSNYDSCIPSIQSPPLPPPPLPQLTIDAIHYSVFNVQGGVLQCVGFVQAVATDLIGVLGNAIDYSIPNHVPGYRLIQRQTGDIKVGDLPVWNIGDNGHIAYVVSVQNDGGFRVAEANNCYPDCGKVGLHDEFTSDPTLVGWLRKI